MAKKKKAKLFTEKSTKEAQCSFLLNVKKKRKKFGGDKLRTYPLNQTENADFLESRKSFQNLIREIIKEFSVIRKSDGLITGTNEVLRFLEKKRLTAVFLFKDKASSVLNDAMFRLCKSTNVPLIRLEESDRHILGPEFPKSITYGIKEESVSTLDNLKSLLLEFLAKRNKKDNGDTNVGGNKEAVSFTDISSTDMDLPSMEETTNQEVLDASIFYHTHEGHITKKSNIAETGFLSLNKFSADERNKDFLDYDSVACSGTLSMK